jgi:hypothetical protein
VAGAGADHPAIPKAQELKARPGKIRIDLHLHSEYSPDSRTSLSDLIARCKEVGLDRIALTDHNTAEGARELARREPDLAIVGEEIKTTEGEIIGLFLAETIEPRLTPEQTLDRIHDQGGLAYLAHPFDLRRARFDPRRVVELADRVDIIETYNQWSDLAANQAAEAMAVQLDLVRAWGSDSHAPPELGRVWMDMDPYSGPADFLVKLRAARPGRSPQSGRSRRA